MARIICFAFFCLPMLAATAPGSEPASGDEMVPGFKGIAWSSVARIELIEGEQSVQSLGKGPRKRPISEVVLYRFRDDNQRPLARGKDAVAPAGDADETLEARLEKRGKSWLALITKHNPLVQLDLVHRDTTRSGGFMGGVRVTHDVKQKSTIHRPSDEAVATAQAKEFEGTQAVLAEYQRRKDIATFWYYAGNALLGCAALAVLAFVILPAVRKVAPVPVNSPSSQGARPEG